MFLNIASLVILSSAFTASEGFFYSHAVEDLNLGSNCILKGNEQGYCEEFTKCEYAQLLYNIRKSSEIKLCKFVGTQPLVCCASIPKLSNQIISEKPSKFQNALCKTDQIVYSNDNQISSGVNAEVGEFTFQAAIGYKSEDGRNLEFHCGGSLTADDIVLTAANCVNRKFRVPVMVRLGRTSLDLNNFNDRSKVQDIEIATIRIHPKYTRRSHHNDIAIIKLKSPYKPSDSISPICLSTGDGNLPKNFIVIGFGRVNQFAKNRSTWLLKGKISEYPIKQCKQKLLTTAGIKIADSQFCGVSNTGVDICRGEIGSSVIYKQNNVFQLQAITSFGVACGTTYPAMYTRVSKFLGWIEAEMNSL